jgi:hypothetical protein
MMNKDLNGHNNGPQSPSRVTSQPTYLYDYEEYDTSSDDPVNDHVHQQQQFSHYGESIHRVDLDNSPAGSSTKPPTPPTTSTSTTTPTMTMTTTTMTTSTTTAPTTPTKSSSQPLAMPSSTGAETSSAATSAPNQIHQKQQSLSNIHLTTAKPAMLPTHQQPPPPVTSMPLDSANGPLLLPPVHENFVEAHRPVEYYNSNNNNIVHSTIHFGPNAYSRPGSVISVLPESTSNVIVPHDQDTVSFVLGNRQNVEGSYYTLGSAVEEHPYAPNANGNNFRPMLSSVSFKCFII